MKRLLSLCILTISILFTTQSCTNTQQKNQDNSADFMEETVSFAAEQYSRMLDKVEDSAGIVNPKSIIDGKMKYIPPQEWTSGFFPGSLWYLYELTGDEKWKPMAVKYTEALDTIQYYTGNHDVGFMIYCSYGNGLRLAGTEAYKEVILNAAKSLSTRYISEAGIIQSWNANKSKDWECPVIIDNMMNLELLFKASQFSGDSTFHKMAVSHANQTMANHYREDWSCYHVVDYDKEEGGVRSRQNAQGYAHESAWARGQAWGIYGFAVAYRYTNDERYLEMAEKIYHFLFTHPNMPEDLVPYWDFNAPNIPNEPRDASAAAVIASALYELSGFGMEGYKEKADQIITSLAGDAYKAIVGTNGNFLLMHSVGSIPHGNEIDVPLNYADYYFLEALTRKIAAEK